MRKLSPPSQLPSTYTSGGRGLDASGASVPSPVEGWDAISPIAAMSPKRAVRLINWFPQPDWVEPRKGYAIHSDTGSGEPVETVAAYHGTTSDKLFAASVDTIYDVTSANSTSAEVTGLNNARFQYINFAGTGGNFLYMVNGADDPQYFDGTSWATATITGVSGDDLVYVNNYKNRLWFAQNSSMDAWYLDTDAIQGAATKFPLGGLFNWGGYLMAVGTWSVDAGNGPQDYIVFVTSRGQAAIYGGSDPATDFSLVGVFNMGAPIGRRCLTRVGSDLAIISIDGVVPFSKIMIFERAAVPKIALTERIQRVMNQSARNYGGNFGWQLISYPRGTRAILNVPIIEGGEQQQYVMNTLSGAWCQFTNMNANCWEIYLDDPYFGGNDGIVYLADTGSTDYNNVFRADMMTAFNYFNMRGRLKRWMMCQPLIRTDQQVNPGIAFNVDFQENAPISTQSLQPTAESLWDMAVWDQNNWGGEIVSESNWTSVTGLGYCSSIRMVIEVAMPSQLAWGSAIWGISKWGDSGASSEITLQVNGFNMTLQSGSFI